MMAATATLHIGYKALHKYTVDPILLHPFKMRFGGWCIVRAVQVRVAAIGVFKWRFISFRVFAYIWPYINIGAARLKFTVRQVMVPATACAIFRRIEPTLVPGHYQAFITTKSRLFTMTKLRITGAERKQQQQTNGCLFHAIRSPSFYLVSAPSPVQAYHHQPVADA